ncbi:MAG: copper resistance CopC family protein, partial [Actinomycetota bacterium]
MGARRRLAIALAALAAWPAAASAHPALESTSPRAGSVVDTSPRRVALSFRAPVEGAFLRVEVRPWAGGPVVSGAPRRTPGDDALVTVPVPRLSGVFRVTWRAFSQDGHATAGSAGFAVGAAIDPVPLPTREDLDDHGALDVAARLLALAGPILLLGLAAVRALVDDAAARGKGAAGAWREALATAAPAW